MLVEYRHERQPSLNAFVLLITSLEFVNPRFRGKLSSAHDLAEGWQWKTHIKHTLPLMLSVARLFAVHFSSWGHTLLGYGLILQRALGLRPSEMLAVTTLTVALPEHQGLSADSSPIVFALGLATGTKVRRPQMALLHQDRWPELATITRRMLRCVPEGGSLVPYSLGVHNRCLKAVEKQLGLSLGFTPHGARAGFASEEYLSGTPVPDIMAAGRWHSTSSFNTYVDIVSAASVRS